MDAHASSSDLPPLYARWARELLGGEPPREGRATCLDCAMLPAVGEPDGPDYVNRATKCCTYTPVLPNYLAGAILADDSVEHAHGRRALLARIAAGEGVTPLGVARTDADEAIYDALAPTHFGRYEPMKCPHLTSDQLCGIWRHRNAVCATWFCKHERGAVGQDFWDAVREWLRIVERELSVWCVLQAGWRGELLGETLPIPRRAHDRITELPDTPAVPGWGAWRGREGEFYMECAARVRPLRWTEVEGLCGTTGAARAALAQEAFRRLLSDDVPDRLVPAQATLLRRSGDTVVMLSYRGSDPIALSADAQQVVARFDGAPTREVLRRLLEEDGLDVDPALVRYLWEFRLLQPTRAE